MSRPLAQIAYSGLSRLLAPVIRSHSGRKHLAGGGAPERAAERLGVAGRKRPSGPLIWVHAVSVGETRSVLGLISALLNDDPSCHVLLTTTTTTSGTIAATGLPERCLHQFAPLDLPSAVDMFLNHWTPGLAIYVESEIWPNQLQALAARGVPAALVNARLSQASARNWQRFAPGLARVLLGSYARIYAQDDRSAARLLALGAPADRLIARSSLKSAAPGLPIDMAERDRLSELVGARPVWCAVSTHPGEEDVVIKAHQQLHEKHPDALLILAPRHPARGDEVAALMIDADLSAKRRSAGAQPSPGDAAYLADTIGETGLWFTLADVAFLGGGLRPGIGGHNPVEPAQMGCPVLSGENVSNAQDLFDGLIAAGGAAFVRDADALASAVDGWLGSGGKQAGEAARAHVRAAAGTLTREIAADLGRLHK